MATVRKTKKPEMTEDKSTWKDVLTWGVLAVLTVGCVYVLLNMPTNNSTPNDLTHIVAWAAKGFIMSVVAFGIPMSLLGGVRRSPLQSWLMPHVETVKQVSLRVKEKLKTGRSLTEGEYQLIGNLSLHIAVRIVGVCFFAGLMLLRF